MKKYLFLGCLFAAVLSSCQLNDKRVHPGDLTLEEKNKAMADSSNFTTIQWLDSTYKDLGDVKQGRIVEMAFRFKNIGTKPLVIADVSAGCGCTVPEKPEQAFAPGQEGTIKAKFDSEGKEPGEAHKTIAVLANTQPDRLTTLTFRANITQ